MSEGMMDFLTFIVVPLVFIAALLGGIIWAANAASYYSCGTMWPAKFEPQYAWNTGCTIIVDGTRIPSSNYRVL